MAQTEKETFYVRSDSGDSFYVETLNEALAHFVSNDGYRLSLRAGENEIVIRRSPVAEAGLTGVDDPLASEYKANVVIRRLSDAK